MLWPCHIQDVRKTLECVTMLQPTDMDPAVSFPCGANATANYTTVAGDTLGGLSTKFNSGICDIASFNDISNPNLIVPGQHLEIPTGCTTPDNTSCLPKPTSAATATCALAVSSAYVVRSGDTLSNIANNYNITLNALVDANKQIENIDLIFPDQMINIPICPGSQCLVKTYEIESGDLFFDLAAKYGTTVGNIEGVNLNVDPTKLAVGQTVLLPAYCRIAN